MPPLVWMISIYFLVLLLALWRQATPPSQSPSLTQVGSKPWTLHHALMLAGILLMVRAAILLVEAGFVLSITKVPDLKKLPPATQHKIFLSGIIASAIFGLAALGIVTSMLRRLKADLVECFGLKKMHLIGAVFVGVALLFASWPWLQTLAIFAKLTLEDWGFKTPPQDIVELLQGNPPAALWWMFAVVGLLIAPVFEETVFRGIFYPAVKQRCGQTISALIVSALFAILHMNTVALAPLFCMSLALIVAYEATGSLVVPIVFHSGFNAVTFFALLLGGEP